MFQPARLLCLLALLPAAAPAAEPLHRQIGRLVLERGKGKPVSPPADDAEFLRRVHLDLCGTIPTPAAARAFLASTSANKRAELIDRLLASPEHPRRMADLFHVMLMERLGDHPGWAKYLHDAFAKNRPWDQMAREMLRGPANDEATRAASFFLSKRLENYGQNPVDYPALARDVGRLFLGKDLRCAQCHDHLFIKEYKQADFQGLFLFIQGAGVQDPNAPAVGEKPLTAKMEFQSVLTKRKGEVGPRVPGGKEVSIPVFKKGEEFVKPPDRKTRAAGVLKFSPLAELAREVPASPDFARNIVNRLWWVMMGRGLVHPLDLHHRDNPPSHPEVLDLLAREFVAHKYDVRWLLRELALTDTYQRTSQLPAGVTKFEPERFLTTIEKGLSAEQLLWATLEATGERERVAGAAKPAAPAGKGKTALTPLEQARARFVKAFAGPVREPEEEFSPSLKGALFLLNDGLVLSWLTPRPGNLVDRLSKLSGGEKVAEELYLSVMSRRPSRDEVAEVGKFLEGKKDADRVKALSRLAWALLASTEFAVNH